MGSNDSALLSRFELAFPSSFENTQRKDIVSLMGREKDRTASDRRGWEAFVQRTRATQKRAYWVMRAISLRLIPDVDFCAMRAVVSDVAKACRLDARTQERVQLLTRSLTVMSALAEYYDFEQSPKAGQVPRVEDVMDPRFQQLLCSTVEIAKFAVQLLGSAFEVTCADKILQALRGMQLAVHDENPDYLTPQGVRTAGDFSKQVCSQLKAADGCTPDIIMQWMEQLDKRWLRGARHYAPRPAGCEGLPVEVDDSRAPHSAQAARGGVAVHASLLDDNGVARGSGVLEEALNSCVRSMQHHEITATPLAGFGHKLRTRPPACAYKPVQLKSGVFVDAFDRQTIGMEEPGGDAERDSRAIVLNEFPAAHRADLPAPPASKRARYNADVVNSN